MRIRSGYVIPTIVFFFISAYTFSKFLDIDVVPNIAPPQAKHTGDTVAVDPTPIHAWEDIAPIPPGGPGPRPLPDTQAHPVSYLMGRARKEFEETRSRQSKTLDEVVKEYRRRYAMPPPPHFDKWFEFARAKKAQLVDEFDTVHDLIAPFWGLQPGTIRSRTQEALGFENGLIGVAIRDHEVTFMEFGPEWQQNATKAMMKDFLEYLPDMDLAFNIHDEPRVVVPSDDLARLVSKAREEVSALNANTKLVNSFSARAPGLNDGSSFEETKRTRFSALHRQVGWQHSRLSCPPDSPSRTLDDEGGKADDLSRYALGELGFVYNATALADICLSPSLSSSFGFFDQPNFHSIVHDLFPIFSQSKLSSYNDIIYPSPWYWEDKVVYNEKEDMPWAAKNDSLYWRGTTTGAFSRNGGWRRHHRQRIVQKMNSKDQAKILEHRGTGGGAQANASASGGAGEGAGAGASASVSPWETKEVPRGAYAHLVDVRFTMIDQCDPSDCEAQKQVFDVTGHVEQSGAWSFKYLLDMDGFAFSGRFQAFLQSRSMTFKFALFREWHNEWLKPWLHFVPISLRGDEWLEVVRYFDEDERESAAKGTSTSTTSSATSQGQRMAEESREWANQVLRKDDMEVWFFRLLLE
ncbi:Beta-1 [Escovopsis weberi]|uniref:Beta-1 n=1 Tax=Escovopsis weberi TaxID=150374 RepID=A0A0M9VVR1_ESCWE|nr:Beta-1 [Escovopsis weberi]